MMQGWTKWFLISSLSLGVIFEVAKRFDWLPSVNVSLRDPSEPLKSPAHTYGRSQGPQAAQALKPIQNRALPDSKAARSQLLIPPTKNGAFDSHMGQNQKAPQNQAKKGEAQKVEKSKTKKCIDKEGRLVVKSVDPSSETDLALNNADAAADEQAKKSDYQDMPEACEDEESVAKNEETLDEALDENAFKEKSEQGHVGGYFGGAPLAQNPDSTLAGLENWKKLLLNQPNFKEVVRLIELHQAGQVNPELFYVLVHLMLEDSREQIREYGVLAAGRTPSFDSYHALMGILKKEAFGSPLRIKAEAELKFYTQIAFLPVIENIMKNSSDIFAIVYATQKLEESARRHLVGSPRSAPSHAKYYQRFVVILQSLSKSQDSEQASQARQTLLSLQNLLKV